MENSIDLQTMVGETAARKYAKEQGLTELVDFSESLPTSHVSV